MRDNPEQIILPHKVKVKEIDSSILIEDEELKERRRKRITLIGQLLIGIFGFVLWELFAKWKIIDAYYWSSPSIIWETGLIAFTEGTLWSDLLYTSGATILGFLLGTFFGHYLDYPSGGPTFIPE